MNILAIDTSAQYLSLAVEVDGSYFQSMDMVLNKQSTYLINQIDSLLKLAKIDLNQIDIIAYIEGPGSFTGLRVGLSVALGIGLGINAKLVGIPTFALHAKASLYIGDILVGIDARLEQIYLAGINTTTLDYFLSPQVINPSEIELDRECHLLGNGFDVYHNSLTAQLKSYKILEVDYPSARYMVDIVKQNKYPLVSPHMANLVYLRNKVALNTEEQRLMRKSV